MVLFSSGGPVFLVKPGKIAWCSCIGEKAGEEVKLRETMTEKDSVTENIISGKTASFSHC